MIKSTDRILNLRNIYLRRIAEKWAEGYICVYLDETWYDTHDVKKKGFSDSSVHYTLPFAMPSRGQRVIIVHAGFLDGAFLLACKNIKEAMADYHSEMNAQVFENYIQTQLLPMLERALVALVADTEVWKNIVGDENFSSSASFHSLEHGPRGRRAAGRGGVRIGMTNICFCTNSPQTPVARPYRKKAKQPHGSGSRQPVARNTLQSQWIAFLRKSDERHVMRLEKEEKKIYY